MLMVGAVLLLALFDITQGKLVNSGVYLLKRWFGLGRFMVAGVIFITGWVLLLWRKSPPQKFSLGRLIMVELGMFLLLGALSAIFNDSVPQINAGNSAGGIVGFGLAYPLRAWVGSLLTGLIFLILALILLIIGFRLAYRIEGWARGETIGTPLVPLEAIYEEPSTLTLQPQVVSEATGRTSLKVSSKPTTQMELPLGFKRGELVDNNKSKAQKPLRPRSDELPPLALLEPEKTVVANQGTINMNAGMLEKTLADFGVPAKVIGYRVGPTVTQYAIEPGYFDKGNTEEKQKVRISQISGLAKDLALALKAERLRIEAPVPGESYVGIEIPNTEHMIVRLKPLLASPEFNSAKSSLAIPLGRGVSGQPVIGDLSSMPHLLIAGTTNSGKSVCIAAITMALVMNNHPDDLRLVMVDPKLVELKRFNGLPHLLGQVETNIERIKGVLRWATTEMDNRYRLLEVAKSRNLETYNHKMDKAGKPRLPWVVILIDELADLMMTAPDETESA
ncbi:MAG: DNA translocase FtsK, partial [Chloroflexi bacterium]|nr:DNA translocase FtsK [Chloroflexota bacterium]